jgi:hypothetical protein
MEFICEEEFSKKKIVVHHRNGYGMEFIKEFDYADEYLLWKRFEPEFFNTKNETYLEITKITTKWLPLDWRGLI